MRESVIEQYLSGKVVSQGGLCLKLFGPAVTGFPDRTLLLPLGRVVFVEVKAPGKVPRPSQVRWQLRLAGIGFKVAVVDSYEAVDKLMESLRGV